MSTNNELIRGSIEVVILKLLSENDMYGYQMIKTVNERSNGFFEWREGSLYPCLHKLVGEKLVTSCGAHGCVAGVLQGADAAATDKLTINN